MDDRPLTRVEFNMDEVHDISVDLLHSLEDSEVQEGLAIIALALSLGRMLSPDRPMEEDGELNYIQSVLDWSNAFFAEGGVN